MFSDAQKKEIMSIVKEAMKSGMSEGKKKMKSGMAEMTKMGMDKKHDKDD